MRRRRLVGTASAVAMAANGARDGLRTGVYSKTRAFTLSTTRP